jgi:GTP-binding protein Era
VSGVSGERAGERTRSGFAAIAGRPNVGKSTLLNTLAGTKVAAVSDRPQTTRRAVRGVWTRGDRQVVFVDLPGVQRPRDALTARMDARVRDELAHADAVLMLVAGDEPLGPGDRYIARTLVGAEAPVTIAVNKADRLKRPQLAFALAQAAELGVGEDVFPVSARTGAGIGELVEHLASQMPQGPFLFETHQRSDQPRELLLAELIREAAVRRTHDELPHAIEVVVEELEWPKADLVRVRALIWVETESQKGIVVGAHGRMIKLIGSAARKELEGALGARVYLDLSVRVRRGWRADESLLDRLGIT